MEPAATITAAAATSKATAPSHEQLKHSLEHGNKDKHDHQKEKPAWGRVTKADTHGALATKDTSATASTFFTPGGGGPKWD